MFAVAVKIAPPVKVRKSWAKPVAVNERLGFEVSAYAGNNWVKPVAVNQRLGFEVTAYAGSK